MVTLAPGAPLLAFGPPGWVAYTALGIGSLVFVGAGAIYMANKKADDRTSDKPVGRICDTCKPAKDPCKGLRDQLEKHKRKLDDYQKDLYAHDNRGLLGKGQDAATIAQRMDSLQQQIAHFEREVKKCEESNGL